MYFAAVFISVSESYQTSKAESFAKIGEKTILLLKLSGFSLISGGVEDHPHLDKTEVENTGQERPYETIKYTSSLSNTTDTPETLPKGNDHVYPYSYVTEKSFKGKEEKKQPYSYIQEPYIDLKDINEVSVRQYRGKVENYFSFSF